MAKVINEENLHEGRDAESAFIYLHYILLKDGEIFNGQTSYLPVNLIWLDFLDTQVIPSTDAVSISFDASIIRNGAMLAAVSFLDDAYSEDGISDADKIVVETLRASRAASEPELTQFLNAISIPNNFQEVTSVKKRIFDRFVIEFWRKEICSLPVFESSNAC
jgi:hypothetical protein